MPHARNARLYNDWLEFHAANPQIYKVFCEYVDKVINRGFKKYRSTTIWARRSRHVHTNLVCAAQCAPASGLPFSPSTYRGGSLPRRPEILRIDSRRLARTRLPARRGSRHVERSSRRNCRGSMVARPDSRSSQQEGMADARRPARNTADPKILGRTWIDPGADKRLHGAVFSPSATERIRQCR
jgi:hypothetical protein